MDTKVLLPAPFSPSSASTSPRASVSEMASLASSAPKRLVMPVSYRTGAASAIGSGAGRRAEPAGRQAAAWCRTAARGGLHLALGWLSSTVTLKLPARIAASRALTLAISAAGTLPSNVPSALSSLPLAFIWLRWP